MHHEGTIRKTVGNGQVIRLVKLPLCPQEWVDKFAHGRDGYGVVQVSEIDDIDYIVREKGQPSAEMRAEMVAKMTKAEWYENFLTAQDRYIDLALSICGVVRQKWTTSYVGD